MDRQGKVRARTWGAEREVPDDEWKHATTAFDLDSWIAQYCPELGSPQPWKGRTQVDLSRLPVQ